MSVFVEVQGQLESDGLHARARARASRLASWACAALIVSAAVADAQPAVFVKGLSELTVALEGTFGDEGSQIGPALDKMAGALAEWDRTIRTVEARVAAEPSNAAAAHVTLGRMYVERGRLTEAQRELEAANQIDPRAADVYVLRALVLDATSNSTQAAEAFLTAWTLQPDDPVKAYYAASASRRKPVNAQDVERARQVLTRAYSRLVKNADPPASSPFVSVGLIHERIADTPVLPLARYAPGYARLAAADYDGAIAELRKAAAGDPLFTDPAPRSVSIGRAIAALREGRLTAAHSFVTESKTPVASSEAHRVLGLIYWASADYDKSIEQLRSAIALNPLDERSRLTLARVQSSIGRYADAERSFLETIQACGESALAHWWLALEYERLNRPADARREVEFISSRAIAGRNGIFSALGRLAGNATDVAAAVDAFARAVTANPNDAAGHKYLAGALLQQDRADEAFVEFVASLLIDPLDSGAYTGIGRIRLDGGRYDDAVEALKRAIDLSPGDTEARYALATALTRLGRTKDAAREFARVEDAQRRALAERRRNMSVDVLKEEAAVHVAAGRYDAAVALFEKVIVLNRDPAVYRQLADLYSKLGRIDDAARARAMYENAAP